MLKNERSMLAQLKCGILLLRMETGRYIGEQLDNRLCAFCTDFDIESETHFLVSSSRYEKLRVQVFGQILSTDSFLCLSPDQNLYHQIKKSLTKTRKIDFASFSCQTEIVYSKSILLFQYYRNTLSNTTNSFLSYRICQILQNRSIFGASK